jgi:AraC family transcriptional regulator
MNTTTNPPLAEPRYVDGPGILLAGLRERMPHNSPDAIPAMWQRFGPFIGTLAAQVGRDAYGVVLGGGPGEEMDYMCAVEVSGPEGMPGLLQHLQLAPQRYAVFRHAGHVSGVHATWSAIINDWLPRSGVRAIAAPWIEHYGPEFDPVTGLGGVDLMVPVE